MVISRWAVVALSLTMTTCQSEEKEIASSEEVQMPDVGQVSPVEEKSQILHGGFFILDQLLDHESPQSLQDEFGAGQVVQDDPVHLMDSCTLVESFRLFENQGSRCYWQQCDCPSGRYRLTWAQVDSAIGPGEWRTRSGLYLGMPLEQVHILNGEKMDLTAWGDSMWKLESFGSGAFATRQEGYTLSVQLEGAQDSARYLKLSQGQPLSSRSRDLRELSPKVNTVWVWRRIGPVAR